MSAPHYGDDDLRWAVDEVLLAIQDEGPVPTYHRDVMRRHRSQWPALWHALDRLSMIRRSEAGQKKGS